MAKKKKRTRRRKSSAAEVDDFPVEGGGEMPLGDADIKPHNQTMLIVTLVIIILIVAVVLVIVMSKPGEPGTINETIEKYVPGVVTETIKKNLGWTVVAIVLLFILGAIILFFILRRVYRGKALMKRRLRALFPDGTSEEEIDHVFRVTENSPEMRRALNNGLEYIMGSQAAIKRIEAQKWFDRMRAPKDEKNNKVFDEKPYQDKIDKLDDLIEQRQTMIKSMLTALKKVSLQKDEPGPHTYHLQKEPGLEPEVMEKFERPITASTT